MRFTVCCMALAVAAPAGASSPPPPPAHVMAAANLLAAPDRPGVAEAAALIADDVAVFENGSLVAKGKAAWRERFAADPPRRVLGYSESSAGPGDGELLVVDTYDTVDRAHLPPNVLVDPRMATRSTLYQFGADHLIHFVRIAKTSGFWIAPRR